MSPVGLLTRGVGLGAIASLMVTLRYLVWPPLKEPVLPAVRVSTRVLADSVVVRPGDSNSAIITNHDPFRVRRAPSSTPYDPTRAPGAPALPPTPPKPALVISGIILGPQAAALIDGLPGIAGTRLVTVGERVAGYRLREVRRDLVVVSGPDTTWNLRVQRRTP